MTKRSEPAPARYARGPRAREGRRCARMMNANDQLIEASQRGDLALAQFAIERGADADAKSRGCTALWWACQYGQIEIARLLISRGADINARDERDGFSPLAQAVGESHLDLVRFLIASGADPNQESNHAEGGTPLHTACAYGLAACAELLLSLGADAGLKDREGRTPQDFARMYGHNELECTTTT